VNSAIKIRTPFNYEHFFVWDFKWIHIIDTSNAPNQEAHVYKLQMEAKKSGRTCNESFPSLIMYFEMKHLISPKPYCNFLSLHQL